MSAYRTLLPLLSVCGYRDKLLFSIFTNVLLFFNLVFYTHPDDVSIATVSLQNNAGVR